ncbi:aminoacyl-tRNA deacylase [Actinomycetes bacterium M1A6_2h]
MAGTATPATTALKKNGIDFVVHTYDHDPGAESYGGEAVDQLASALAVSPAQIFKTLVVRAPDGTLAVAVLPVPHRLSTKAFATTLGVGKVVMADRTEAERSTGYVLGGISPVGQRKSLRTVVDDSALHWPRILCSGGRRGLEIDLDPRDLVRVTAALVGPIATH